MKNRRNTLLLLGLLTLVIVIVSVQLLAAGKEDDRITREAMIKTLESRYAGSVTSILLVDEAGQTVYKSTLQGKNGTYQISSEAHSGRIMHITPVHINAKESGELTQATPAKPQSQENAAYGISLDRARVIAMEQVEGVFDGIEVEEVSGNAVYEVEIDTLNGQEVKVQVDAYTGKVLSVLWEDS
jgi:uncharacterized membrane protein YkoI